MSTVQDAIDLTTSPSTSHPLPPSLTSRNPRHRRSASQAHEGVSDVASESDRRRQKRRRVDVGHDAECDTAHPDIDVEQAQSGTQQPPPTPADTSQSSSAFNQISTWEIPPDIVVPRPTGEEPPQVSPSPAPVNQPVTASSSDSVAIDLTDLNESTVISSKADWTSSGTAPVVINDKPPSPSSSSAIPTFTVSPPEPLSAYTCPICLSPPTNATLTPCGHVCCGQCLFTAVKSTMRRNMVVAMERAPAAR